jgi:hypothetical protein
MRTTARRTLLACLIGIAMSGSCLAGVHNFISPEVRAATPGRDLQIIVPQAEIQSSINPSGAGLGLGGGLLPALIAVAVDDAHAKQAEKKIVPLRAALADYDFDARVRNASPATLAQIEWFGLRETRFGKDASSSGVLAGIKNADTPQLMYLTYSYQADDDFSSMVVLVRAVLVNRAMPKSKIKNPMMRFWPNYVVFDQTMRSVVTLPAPDKWNPETNVQAWAADGGKLARTALDLGVQRCQELLQRNLQMSAREATNMIKRKGRKMVNDPGVTGWVLESDATHKLVYSAQNHWTTYAEKAGPARAASDAR